MEGTPVSVPAIINSILRTIADVRLKNTTMINYYVHPGPVPTEIAKYEPRLAILETRVVNLSKLSQTHVNMLVDGFLPLLASWVLPIATQLANSCSGFQTIFIEHYDRRLEKSLPYLTLYDTLKHYEGTLHHFMSSHYAQGRIQPAETLIPNVSADTPNPCRGAIAFMNGRDHGKISTVDPADIEPHHRQRLADKGGAILWWECPVCAFKLRYHAGLSASMHVGISFEDAIMQEDDADEVAYRSAWLVKCHVYHPRRAAANTSSPRSRSSGIRQVSPSPTPSPSSSPPPPPIYPQQQSSSSSYHREKDRSKSFSSTTAGTRGFMTRRRSSGNAFVIGGNGSGSGSRSQQQQQPKQRPILIHHSQSYTNGINSGSRPHRRSPSPPFNLYSNSNPNMNMNMNMNTNVHQSSTRAHRHSTSTSKSKSKPKQKTKSSNLTKDTMTTRPKPPTGPKRIRYFCPFCLSLGHPLTSSSSSSPSSHRSSSSSSSSSSHSSSSSSESSSSDSETEPNKKPRKRKTCFKTAEDFIRHVDFMHTRDRPAGLLLQKLKVAVHGTMAPGPETERSGRRWDLDLRVGGPAAAAAAAAGGSGLGMMV